MSETPEQQLERMDARMQELRQEMADIRADADTRIARLRDAWTELYDSNARRELRRRVRDEKHAAERAKGIKRCNLCGGLKDEPAVMSDDSYSRFSCPSPFHR